MENDQTEYDRVAKGSTEVGQIMDEECLRTFGDPELEREAG